MTLTPDVRQQLADIDRATAETFDQHEPAETRQARWEAAALAAGREVDRNALRAYMAVADAEQKALADQWAHSAAASDAEIRRLHAELDAAPGKALAVAADVVDAKLTAEPDHNRASALYELLLQLRGELPCTCARTGGLHAKDCGKYVPGHELISRHNALARYRAERTTQPAA
jgi:hypothetical protein